MHNERPTRNQFYFTEWNDGEVKVIVIFNRNISLGVLEMVLRNPGMEQYLLFSLCWGFTDSFRCSTRCSTA